MNLLNVLKHLLYLTQTEYDFEHSLTTTDENKHSDIINHFTLEEMETTVEWIYEHF